MRPPTIFGSNQVINAISGKTPENFPRKIDRKVHQQTSTSFHFVFSFCLQVIGARGPYSLSFYTLWSPNFFNRQKSS